jgi:hypothetical protein
MLFRQITHSGGRVSPSLATALASRVADGHARLEARAAQRRKHYASVNREAKPDLAVRGATHDGDIVGELRTNTLEQPRVVIANVGEDDHQPWILAGDCGRYSLYTGSVTL